MGKKKDRGKDSSKCDDEAIEGCPKSVEGESAEPQSKLTSGSAKAKKKQKSSKLDQLKQMIDEAQDDGEPSDGHAGQEARDESTEEGQSRKKQKGTGKKSGRKAGGAIGEERGHNVDSEETMNPTEKVTKEVAAFRFDHSSESETEKDKDEPGEKGT